MEHFELPSDGLGTSGTGKNAPAFTPGVTPPTVTPVQGWHGGERGGDESNANRETTGRKLAALRTMFAELDRLAVLYQEGRPAVAITANYRAEDYYGEDAPGEWATDR